MTFCSQLSIAYTVHMYDVIIVGGGPAGVSAAIYCARKRMKTLFLAREVGGQSSVSDDIQNWIGHKSISGLDLAKQLDEHLRAQDGIEIHIPESVTRTAKIDDGFEVETDKGKYTAQTLILCAGSHRRKLGVPGEKEFEGKGVMYCATCDAPIFAGMDVAVVGGGNAGLESVIDLIPYASHITLLVRGSAPKGDPITLEKVKASDKVTIITQATTVRVEGEKMLSGLVYADSSGNEQTLSVRGVFVEIGALPNSGLAPLSTTLNEIGEVVINHRTGETNIPGLFAAGDVTDVAYKQNNISSGDGVKAALSAYKYVQERS